MPGVCSSWPDVFVMISAKSGSNAERHTGAGKDYEGRNEGDKATARLLRLRELRGDLLVHDRSFMAHRRRVGPATVRRPTIVTGWHALRSATHPGPSIARYPQEASGRWRRCCAGRSLRAGNWNDGTFPFAVAPLCREACHERAHA
jgi:hypothetical protein